MRCGAATCLDGNRCCEIIVRILGDGESRPTHHIPGVVLQQVGK